MKWLFALERNMYLMIICLETNPPYTSQIKKVISTIQNGEHTSLEPYLPFLCQLPVWAECAHWASLKLLLFIREL